MKSNEKHKVHTPATLWMLTSSLVVAFALWMAVFVWQPFNFWLMMTISTSVLILLTRISGERIFNSRTPSVWDWIRGGLLALVLYGIFWAGNHPLVALSDLLPVLGERERHLQSVYANRGVWPPALVALVLFFPIGFAEEVFWRGYIQKVLSRRVSPAGGFFLATALYTGVHLPTANPILILASLVCGLFWGGLYWKTGRLWPLALSHMLWDPFIFVFFPLQ